MKVLNTLTVSGATTMAAASASSLTLTTALAIAQGGTGQITGYAAHDALTIHGADIAISAGGGGSINLEASTGMIIDATGNTNFATITLSEGHVRIVRFTGTPTITHGANLVLPGSANITCVAGDIAIFVGYASSVVRCVLFSPITVTGTGAIVKQTSPTLTTPNIGTPSAGTLTNCTGLPIGGGGTGQTTGYAALDALSIHGADVASATTTNLETATGYLIDVTGTTTITAITLSEGHHRVVRFTGILTLTHGSSLILPGAANITTAAGDFAIFVGYAAGVVRCINFEPFGVFAPARLGTGSSISSKYLRGDSTWQTLAGGGDALTTNPLSQFAATSSSQLLGVMSDETGTGLVVFNDTPTLVTPVLGVATATTVNKVTITAPASSATLTIPNGVVLTGPAASGTAMTLENAETITGVKTFGSAGDVGNLKVAGTTSGSTILDAMPEAGSGTTTLPIAGMLTNIGQTIALHAGMALP